MLSPKPARQRSKSCFCEVSHTRLKRKSALDAHSPLSYKVLMTWTSRALAAFESLLIFPAVLFMSALFVRNLQPQQYEPARTAQRIVDWYAARTHLGLWVLLFALPLTVLATGCGALVKRWNDEPALREAALELAGVVRLHWATLLVALATVTSGGILAIVALHVLTD